MAEACLCAQTWAADSHQGSVWRRGRGLKVVWKAEDIDELYGAAVREAVTAFGRGECFVEQFLDKPRHIEAQVMADQHGNVRVLGTRDCSLQRRNRSWWKRRLRRF